MKKTKDNSFEKKVRIALAEKGETQASLARKIGATRSQMNLWLHGRRTPKTESLMKLAAALGKPVNYFFDKSPIITGDNNNVNSKVSSEKDVIIMKQKIAIMEKDIENINLRIKLLEGQKKKK